MPDVCVSERAQNSNSLEVYRPLGLSISCPAGSSIESQGSPVDPHAMEDDEEDDVDEVKEFKGNDDNFIFITNAVSIHEILLQSD